MLKRDRVREILNLDVMLIEIVVIPLLAAFYIAVLNQSCCCMGEFAMLNGCC